MVESASEELQFQRHVVLPFDKLSAMSVTFATLAIP